MKKITVTFPLEDDAIDYLHMFIESTKGNRVVGALTVPELVQMLLEDVALAVRRPGSWEGANMISVLTSHGYEI